MFNNVSGQMGVSEAWNLVLRNSNFFLCYFLGKHQLFQSLKIQVNRIRVRKFGDLEEKCYKASTSLVLTTSQPNSPQTLSMSFQLFKCQHTVSRRGHLWWKKFRKAWIFYTSSSQPKMGMHPSPGERSETTEHTHLHMLPGECKWSQVTPPSTPREESTAGLGFTVSILDPEKHWHRRRIPLCLHSSF